MTCHQAPFRCVSGIRAGLAEIRVGPEAAPASAGWEWDDLDMALSERFLPAFLVTLENLAERDYFAERTPTTCVDDHPMYWDSDGVRRALIQQMGRATWPLDIDDLPMLTDSDVLAYVEAFYQFVSKPTESWFHSFCGASHPMGFDAAAGRYDYTVSVNGLLTRFETSLRLQTGKVHSTGSKVLSEHVVDGLPTGGDDHLAHLLSMAVTDFRSPHLGDRWTALRHLADAYERIKSSRVPSNKKESVAEIIRQLAPDEALAEHFDALFRQMTTTSNELTIRHHEVGKVEITADSDLIDFLFYSYFNLVRFALLRLHGPL